MLKKIFLTLLIFCFAAIACAEESNLISQAQALLEQGEYSQSTLLLYEVINQSRTPLHLRSFTIKLSAIMTKLYNAIIKFLIFIPKTVKHSLPRPKMGYRELGC
jgi:hypothetical protein